MKNFTLTLGFLVTFAFVTKAQMTVTYVYHFIGGPNGWSGDFADYPITDSVFYELEFTHTTLPAPLNTTKEALKISGNNHSDDLFMFIKRKISGLLPNTTYMLEAEIEFASNAPTNAVGVGGSPGEGVTMKVGATTFEPKKIVDGIYYRMNTDKGAQVLGGADMDTIGHVGVSDTTTQFTLITRTNTGHPFTVTTNASGEVWVCIGTDSGYEATTTLYYNKVALDFTDVVGVDDLTNQTGVLVYPNPSTGKVSLSGITQNNQVNLYNQYGQQVQVKTNQQNGVLQFDLSGFAKGLYYVQITEVGKTSTSKIVLQ